MKHGTDESMLGKFAVAGFLGLVGATTASAGVVDSRVLQSDIVPDHYSGLLNDSGLLNGMPLFAANGEAKEAPLDEEFPTGQIDALSSKRKHPRGYIVPLDNPIELVDHNPGSNVTGNSRTSSNSSLAQDIFATPIASNVSVTSSSIARADPALQQLNNLAPVIAVPNQVTAIANANVPGQVFVYESLSGSSNPVYVGSAYDPSLWQAQLAAATPPVTPITTPPVTVPPVTVTTPPVTIPPVTVIPITTPPVTVPPVTVTTPPVTIPPVTVIPITTPPVTVPPVTVTTPPVTIPPVTVIPITTAPVTIPPVTVTTPPVTIPPVTVIPITVPLVTILSLNTLGATTPAVTVPAEATLVVTTPAVTVPAEATLVVTTPAVTVPAEATLVVTTPAVTVPAEATPVVTTPAVTIPAETTLVVTTPAVTVPAEATPVVTTPAVTIPAVATLVAVQSAVASPLLASTLDPSDPTTLGALVTAAPVLNSFIQARLSENFVLSDNVRIARGTTPEISTFDLVDRDPSEALVSVNAVPEPTTWAMMLIGLAGLALYKWKHSRLPQPSAGVAR